MKKGLIKIGLLTASLLVLSGCSEDKNINDNKETEIVDVDLHSGPIKDRLEVLEEWSEEIDREKGVLIYASVEIPDVSTMKIIHGDKKYFEDDEKQEFIRKITDNTIYKYPESYEEMNVSWLQDKIKEIENDLASPDSEEEAEAFRQELDELYGYLENAQEEYEEVESFSGDEFVCEFEGYEYRFGFTHEYYDGSQSVVMEILDYKTVVDGDEYKVIFFPTDREALGENQCTITQDEAQKKAEAFVEQLGYGKFSVVDAYPLKANVKYDRDEYGDITAGYSFVFYREIDGALIDGRAWDVSPKFDSTLYNYSDVQEKIFVGVNDAGIVSFFYCGPYDIGEVVVEDTELLSFEKIQEKFADEISKNLDKYSNTLFNHMELKYLYIECEESDADSIIMPVWILSDSDMFGVKAQIVINAVDGEIVEANVY